MPTTMHIPRHSDKTAGMTCPVCHSNDVVIRKGYSIGEFRLLCCRGCTLNFIDPLPSSQDLSDYYTNVYGVAAVKEFRKGFREHPDTKLVSELIGRICPEASTVCEIGCGSGSLLAGLRKRNYAVKGYELSETTARFAQRNFDIDVEVGGIPADLGGRFEIVIERHVIEHTVDPVEELRRIDKALCPEGLVILVTPNFQSLASRLCNSGWEWFIPPDHLYYFNRRSMHRLLDRSGFSVEKVFTRRGDADNLFLVMLKSVYRRGMRKSYLSGYWKSRDTFKQTGRRLALTTNEFLRPITEAMYRLTCPLFFLVNDLRLGEELWLIARKR
jgi:SAM-dependent methyltransferase